MAAVGIVVAAVIVYALYLGRNVKVGLKTPLATFFFESEDYGLQSEKKSIAGTAANTERN
jgi:hypothetical protein